MVSFRHISMESNGCGHQVLQCLVNIGKNVQKSAAMSVSHPRETKINGICNGNREKNTSKPTELSG